MAKGIMCLGCGSHQTHINEATGIAVCNKCGYLWEIPDLPQLTTPDESVFPILQESDASPNLVRA